MEQLQSILSKKRAKRNEVEKFGGIISDYKLQETRDLLSSEILRSV